MTKGELLDLGIERGQKFCKMNSLAWPKLKPHLPEDWAFSSCAYYRPTYIAICTAKCAQLGYGGRSWSWPGYVVDRTPFGVLQHELGHHVDMTLSGLVEGYRGTFSRKLRLASGEEPITTYAPNDAEWFAEIFRLFVTNAQLLRLIRPKVFELLLDRFEPVSADFWRDELSGAPLRTIAAAEKKIKKAAK